MTYREIAAIQIKADEGVKLKVYLDLLGIPTIGVGRNLRDKGLSPAEVDMLLEHDLDDAEKDARDLFPCFERLSDARKAVLLNMALNLGRERLAGFHDMRMACEEGDFEKAASSMLDSRWAKQVGPRAERLAKAMREG